MMDEYKLYINYHTIKVNITNDNCYNLNGDQLAHQIFKKDNILEQIITLNKKYIVLTQFCSIYMFKDIIDNNIHLRILPSKYLMDKYIEIKHTLIHDEYNFIHYRYEHDFTNYFKITINSLNYYIHKNMFKNNKLKIYIATSDIKRLIDLKDPIYSNLLYMAYFSASSYLITLSLIH